MSTQIAQPIQARPHLYVSKPFENCLGRQYTIEDDLWLNVVTIAKDELTGLTLIGCSCGLGETCEHILLVEEEEARYSEQAKQREVYCSAFDPNNMEAIYG